MSSDVIVAGYDLDTGRVKRSLSGESYVEDVVDTRIAAMLSCGRFNPTAEVGLVLSTSGSSPRLRQARP